MKCFRNDHRSYCSVLTWNAGLLVALALSPVALGGLSHTLLSVRVTSATGHAAFKLTPEEAGWTAGDPTADHRWRLAQPISLTNSQSGRMLAQLDQVELYMRNDPCVSMSFSVIAGSEPITIEIESGVLSFAPIECASTSVTAGLTLRDDDGDGASISGRIGPNSDKIVWATYNEVPPPGATFATLFEELTLPPGTRVGAIAENQPPDGTLLLGEPAFSMQLCIGMRLSANDCVTGSAIYDIEPMSVSLADMNCDGVVDFNDVDGFVLVLNDQQSYRESYPGCCGALAGDINGDGVTDFNDIDGFVACVLERGC